MKVVKQAKDMSFPNKDYSAQFSTKFSTKPLSLFIVHVCKDMSQVLSGRGRRLSCIHFILFQVRNQIMWMQHTNGKTPGSWFPN